jgi:CDP-alcohol phosphatidyltransferase
MPSIAELRRVTQPQWLFTRAGGAEHWAGRLYMRRISPYATRLLVATPLSANGVTWLMVASGVLAAAVLTLPGLLPAVGAVCLVQLWLLFDCCDGEVARWRETFSITGVYVDGLGHHATQALLPAALGVRAAGGWDSLDGWTTLGLAVAALVLFVNVESQLVHIARAKAGKPALAEAQETPATRPGAVARARGVFRLLPVYRAFNAVEFTLLALLAAVADAFADSLAGTRAFVLALVAGAVLTAAGHLVVILSSNQLR